jgi:hypothetical protein
MPASLLIKQKYLRPHQRGWALHSPSLFTIQSAIRSAGRGSDASLYDAASKAYPKLLSGDVHDAINGKPPARKTQVRVAVF